MKSSDKLILACVGIIAAIGVISVTMAPKPASVDDSKKVEPAPVVAEPVPKMRSQPVGIAAVASDPYTRDEYPTTFLKFGSAVADVNADRLNAAKIASLHRDCDFVENSQITTRSPKQNRRYWVECSNLTRLFFDQESLARGEPVDVQTKRDWIRDGLKDW